MMFNSLLLNLIIMATVHNMPALPYAPNALEPYMSEETINYHHGKHVKAYVDNLNRLIPGTPFENATLEEIIKKADGPIFNNGAQIWNHEFFFNTFSPKPKTAPSGALMEAIEKEWGSFDNFKAEFKKAGAGLFGSGWAWLVKDGGKLRIIALSNAGNPIRDGLTPVLGIDVWEHSYYIDYRNDRGAFLDAMWNIIDWKVVEERFSR